jgi:nucleotide-binding universal stress UspA family protein
MFKNILVPLDGSPLAEAALPFARALAARTGAGLSLVRAAHYASLLGDAAVDQYHAIQRSEDYLALLVDELAASGLNVQARVPFGGSAAEWIVEECDLQRADLIVMATHDRLGPDRWLHSSVAEAVVHHSTIPVMLVRSAGAEDFAKRFAAQEPALVVPLDGSELAEAALPIARDLANAAGARVVLVGVVPKAGQLIAGHDGAIVTYTGSKLAELEANAWAYLESGVGQLAACATSVEAVVRSGNAATEIAAAARDYRVAAVVMATHGRTGVSRSILGSVAGGVLRQSSGPVVLVRRQELRPAEEPAIAQSAAAPAGSF